MSRGPDLADAEHGRIREVQRWMGDPAVRPCMLCCRRGSRRPCRSLPSVRLPAVCAGKAAAQLQPCSTASAINSSVCAVFASRCAPDNLPRALSLRPRVLEKGRASASPHPICPPGLQVEAAARSPADLAALQVWLRPWLRWLAGRLAPFSGAWLAEACLHPFRLPAPPAVEGSGVDSSTDTSARAGSAPTAVFLIGLEEKQARGARVLRGCIAALCTPRCFYP